MSQDGCICMLRFLSESLHLRSIPAVSWDKQLAPDYRKRYQTRHGVFGPRNPSKIEGLRVAKGLERQRDHHSLKK